MIAILSDSSKFLKLGPADSFDHTASIESKFWRRLVVLVKREVSSLPKPNRLELLGSIRPRLYGLPKTHKAWVPLRPISSMVGYTQHRVAKRLDRILQPVLMHYSTYCSKDSFEFSGFMKNYCSQNKFLCSFVASLLVFPSWKLLAFVQISYIVVI